MKATIYPSFLSGEIEAIASKSQAHRLLICAALADSPTRIRCTTLSADIEATANCLRALGADIVYTDGVFTVEPIRNKPPSAVIDVGEGPIELINPEIVGEEGEQTGDEGCLSVPGMVGTVTRPLKVKVTATGRDGEPFTVEGEGLLARALCHEIDHLDGHMYTEKVTGELRNAEYEEE